MQIIHVITTLDRGGAENQLCVLVQAQIKAGKSAEVIFLKGGGELAAELKAIGATVEENLANKPVFVQVVKLRGILRRDKAAIVHAHLPRAELFVALSGSRIAKVSSRHNAEAFFPKAPRPMSRILAKFVSRKFNRIIAISQAVYEDIQNRGEIDNLEKMKVVHYGFQMRNAVAETDMPIIVDQYGIPDRLSKIVLAVNRLTEQKDIPTLLRAFAILTGSHQDVRLLIAGTGHLEKDLKNLAKNLQIEHRVTWLGHVNNLEAFFSLADVFILCSEYEGFGMVLLESIWADTPIVSSSISAIPEVLGDDYIGLSTFGNPLAFANKLEKMLYESDFRTEAIMQLQRRKQYFSPEIMETNITNMYRSASL